MELYRFFILISSTFIGIGGLIGFYLLLKTIRKLVQKNAMGEVELERTSKKFSSIIKLCLFLAIAFYLIALFSLFLH